MHSQEFVLLPPSSILRDYKQQQPAEQMRIQDNN